MTARVIDGPCPVCNADKNAIVEPDQAARPGYYVCIVCGYDESQATKFPSHEE